MKFYKFITPLILLIVLLPAVMHAQGLGHQRQIKDVRTARGLAINNTLLPVVTGVGAAYLFKNETVRKVGASLAIYGLIMGPSSGNFYAEDYLRGGLGAVLRGGSGYMLIDATREIMGDKVADPLGWDDESVSLTDTKVLIGAGIFLSSMVYNVISARASVNGYNHALDYSFGISHQSIANEVVPLLTARIRF